MLSQMTSFFNSAFYFAGYQLEIDNGCNRNSALFFGAVWLAFYLPPLFKKPMLWVVAVVSAISHLVRRRFCCKFPLPVLVRRRN